MIVGATQGDVIGILDSNLTQVVWYTYDSWGNVVSIKDSNGNVITDQNNIGNINPYRYRGYRLDKETNLYYLNSRYYSPEWQRFINADSVDIFSDENVDHILINNLYAYCLNNPINMVDPDGDVVQIVLIFAVVYLLFTAADMYMTYKNPTPDNVVWAVIGATPIGKAGKVIKPIVKATKVLKYTKVVENANKFTHVFNNSQHKLAPLLKKYGNNQQKAYNAVYDATFNYVKNNGMTGIFEVTVKVSGYNVTVRGNVIDGAVRIGTFFIK
ncbi:MAG: RHS repeat-associated core domain-containing protein [Firmicutes bacterium]|nr:RHS repeat-associated core domain-containing protein [Bacillota bacterium]